jgi:Kef-type K+ transport system membrane component KefB
VLSLEALGLIVAVLLVSAYATDAIGVHPLFGAFLAGLCFPRVPSWQLALRQKLEPLSTLLLPFFFALTGMKTRIDLLHGTNVWLWTGAIIGVAVTGKVGGAVFAGRVSGESWRNALALGALLNTRGLVELIVLNIALNAGAFSPTLFTMLVVMALTTTAMTLPALNLLRVRGD